MAGSITWLGHAAYRFDTPSGDRICVDRWLTGNPTRATLPPGIELVAPPPGETIEL